MQKVQESEHISGAGGQLDFVLGAYLSKRRKELYLLLFYFHRQTDGQLKFPYPSNVSSNGSIVTDTRANIHYFVTEYGKVNLKGLSDLAESRSYHLSCSSGFPR